MKKPLKILSREESNYTRIIASMDIKYIKPGDLIFVQIRHLYENNKQAYAWFKVRFITTKDSENIYWCVKHVVDKILETHYTSDEVIQIKASKILNIIFPRKNKGSNL